MKSESTPPVAVTQAKVNVVDGLLSVKLIVAGSFARSNALLDAIATIGGAAATMASNRLVTAA